LAKEHIVTRLALLERLKEVQLMPRHQGRDITSISAVLSNQALARHLELCEEAAGATPRFAARPDSAAQPEHAGRA
jgi:hypothetical protein